METTSWGAGTRSFPKHHQRFPAITITIIAKQFLYWTHQVCGLPKERGPERDFVVKWAFDMEYGGCSRFWWGGTVSTTAVQKGVPFVKMLFGKSFAYLTSPWETLVSHPNDSEFGIESLVASPEYWRKHDLLGHTFALGWMFKNLLQIIGILVTLASFREETETTLRQRRNAMRSVFIRRAKKYLSLSNQ